MTLNQDAQWALFNLSKHWSFISNARKCNLCLFVRKASYQFSTLCTFTFAKIFLLEVLLWTFIHMTYWMYLKYITLASFGFGNVLYVRIKRRGSIFTDQSIIPPFLYYLPSDTTPSKASTLKSIPVWALCYVRATVV